MVQAASQAFGQVLPDVNETRRFLARFWSQTPMGVPVFALVKGVRRRHDLRPRPGARDLWASNEKQTLQHVQNLTRAGDDVYLGVLLRAKKEGHEGACMEAGWLVADLDYGAAGHSRPGPFRDRAEALARLDSGIVPRPHMVIDTGGGLHAWWQVYGTIDHDDRERAQRNLIHLLDADPVTLPRSIVLRVPGTLNNKLATPRRVKLLDDWSGIEGETDQYDVDLFTRLAPVIQLRASVPAAESVPEKERAGGGAVRAPDRPAAAPSPEPPRARAASASGPALGGVVLPGDNRPANHERPGDAAKRIAALDVFRWLGLPFTQRGNEGRAACPMHQGSNKTSMALGGKNPHALHCFSDCTGNGHGGDWTAVDLVMRLEGLSYQGAVNWLAERAGFVGFPTPAARRAPPLPPAARSSGTRPAAAPVRAAAAEDFDDERGELVEINPETWGEAPEDGGEEEHEEKGGGGGEPPARPPSGGGGSSPSFRRVAIEITTEEAVVADEALAALVASEAPFYSRGGQLIQIVEHKPKASKHKPKIDHAAGKPLVLDVPLPQVRSRLSRACDFYKRVVKENAKTGEISERDVNAHVPDWCAKDILTRGEWDGIRPFAGYVECPTLRPDGTLITEPGYDEQTGLIMRSSVAFDPIPEHPTRAQAKAALERLIDLVWSQDKQERDTGFQFEKPGHKSAWLAALLTPIARHAWGPGVSPMFLVDANVSGAGKGLLLDVIGGILYGREMSKMPQASKPEAEEKLITAIVKVGSPTAVIDNIKHTLGGENLESLLTSPVWMGRILGASDLREMPTTTVWYGTGTQVKTTTDMIRRVVYMRLKSDRQDPANRQNYKWPKVVQYVKKHRGELASKAATILMAWLHYRRSIQALAPGDEDSQTRADPANLIPEWSTYADWGAMVRGALLWLGMEDPASTSESLGSGEDTDWLSDLHDGWQAFDPDGRGLSGQDVVKKLRDDFDDHNGRLMRDDHAPFLAALGQALGSPPDKLPSAGKFGYRLPKVVDVVVNGKRLVKLEGRAKGNVARWAVELVDVPAQTTATRGPIVWPMPPGGWGDGEGDGREIDLARGDISLTPPGLTPPTPTTKGDLPTISGASPQASPGQKPATEPHFGEMGRSKALSLGMLNFSGLEGVDRASEAPVSPPEAPSGDDHAPYGENEAIHLPISPSPSGASVSPGAPISSSPLAPSRSPTPQEPAAGPIALGPLPPLPTSLEPLDDLEEAERAAIRDEGGDDGAS